MSSSLKSEITPSLIATLATGPALVDLKILLGSLSLFNPLAPPTVYLYCDEAIASVLDPSRYAGKLVIREALNAYSGLSRATMERAPSRTHPNLWFEFMAQKLELLYWTFQSEPLLSSERGVLFCDADICFFAPLPQIPKGAVAALSPHGIRASDEARYGRYNGGFFWFFDESLIHIWKEACSLEMRFYEQAALEVVAEKVKKTPNSLYEFSRAQNYGWWRLWQGEAHPEKTKEEWTMNRRKFESASGILIGGEALGSVHTHFAEKRDTATVSYNGWLFSWLQKLAPSHPPAKKLLGLLHSCIQN